MKSSPIILVVLVALGIGAGIYFTQSSNTQSSPSAPTPPPELDTKALEDKLKLDILAIADSPVDGLKQITTNQGLFYLSDNGEHFIQGRVYNVSGEVVDETDLALRDMRLAGIEKYKDSGIEFAADNEEFVISVFTDITCGYCRKLHNEMAQFNDLGITVRYLAWPRGGLNSKSYRDMVSVWCDADPQQAMSKAKSGTKIENPECDNKVAEHFTFGRQVGVGGTPNIVLPDGSVIPGYQPANMIADILRKKASS